MSRNNRRSTAKYMLAIYILVIGSFQLAHTEYVPLDSGRWLSVANPLANNLDVINGRHICPAQLFAQSTTNVGVVAPRIFVPDDYTILSPDGQRARFAKPVREYATRAPPRH